LWRLIPKDGRGHLQVGHRAWKIAETGMGEAEQVRRGCLQRNVAHRLRDSERALAGFDGA